MDGIRTENAKLRQRLDSDEAKIADLQKEIGDLKFSVEEVHSGVSNLEEAKVQNDARRGSAADADNVEAIRLAISQCVKQVRANPNQGAFNLVLPAFDAYYNPATHQVQDNVTYAQQKPARYAFKKCMAERGIVVGQ